MRRRDLLGYAASGSLVATVPAARADGYPSRPVRIVVGFGTGGTIDALSRILADRLAKILGGTVIVENRPGAGGNLAATSVVKAPPDGYTLLLGGTNYVIGLSWYRNLSFDVAKDLRVVSTLTRNANVLVVGADAPYRTVQDLVADAKRNPRKLTFSSAGAGTVVHLAGELFKGQAGIDIRHIPYNAVAPAELDLIAGRVTMMFDSLPSALPFIRDGKMRALGVTSADRSAYAPDIPTLVEGGVAGYDVSSWYALWAAAPVPDTIVQQVSRAVAQAFDAPEMKERLKTLGGEAFPNTPQGSDVFVRAELVKWTKAVELLGPRGG